MSEGSNNTFTTLITNVPAGIFTYRVIANDSFSTNRSQYFNYVINKGTLNLSLFLNGIDGNITVFPETDVNSTAYLQGFNSTIFLYKNGSLIASGFSPLQNISRYAEGMTILNAFVNESQNYTSRNISGSVTAVLGEFDVLSNECPTTTNASIILYGFLGVLLLAMAWVGMTIIQIPFFNIILGMGIIMYSFTMFSCLMLVGWTMLMFGVGIAISGFLGGRQ
jgi:hypothetical protein